MYRLPQMASGQLQRIKQWIQTNRSDTIGNLAWTFNIDPYYNLGKIRPTRMIQTTTSATNTGMTNVPVGFRFFYDGNAQRIYTVAGSFVHANSGNNVGSFTKFTTASSFPTTCSSLYSDIELAFGVMYVTTASNSVYQYNGSWSNFTAGGSASQPHQLTAYGGRMYMTHTGNQIISWNSSNTVASMGSDYTLNNGGNTAFDSQQQITFIRSSSNRIWIGVGSISSQSKGKGFIYEWDGVSQSTTRSYKLEATAPMACVIKDDIPYVLDSNGRLLKYNSGSFGEVARLPLNDRYLTNPLGSDMATRFIHPNGISIINGKINFLINNKINDSDGSIMQRCPSGVWEYDENVGLYHKYSLSYTPVLTNTITDYGQNRLSAVGALSDMKVDSTASSANGSFMLGATVFTNASSTDPGVWVNDTLPFSTIATSHSTLRAGYLVTTKLESTGITDIWKGFVVKYKRLINSADKIIVKYRTVESTPVESTITWINSSYFTTTGISGFAVGDEVEITQGTGGGMCSHITAITYDGSSAYGVTVDEPHTGVTIGTAKARFQKWIKIGSIADTTSQFKQGNFPTSASSTWIQLKVFMLMDEGDELEEIAVVNSVSQDLK